MAMSKSQRAVVRVRWSISVVVEVLVGEVTGDVGDLVGFEQTENKFLGELVPAHEGGGDKHDAVAIVGGIGKSGEILGDEVAGGAGQGEVAVIVGAGILAGLDAALEIAKDAGLQEDVAAECVFLTDDDVGHGGEKMNDEG